MTTETPKPTELADPASEPAEAAVPQGEAQASAEGGAPAISQVHDSFALGVAGEKVEVSDSLVGAAAAGEMQAKDTLILLCAAGDLQGENVRVVLTPGLAVLLGAVAGITLAVVGLLAGRTRK